jgi:hypothetical protein
MGICYYIYAYIYYYIIVADSGVSRYRGGGARPGLPGSMIVARKGQIGRVEY